MMLLRWRAMPPPITTQWRGPDGALAQTAQDQPEHPVPTLIGPPGPAGPEGPQGPVAEIIDGGEFN